MKKKIVLISILLIISNSLFGEDFKPKGYLNFDVGTGVLIENDIKLNTSVLINPVVVGFQGIRTINEKSAFKIGFEVLFPYNYLSMSDDKLENISSLIEYSFGYQLFFGGSFCIVNNDRHLFTISGGCHFMMVAFSTSYKRAFNIAFGAGASFDYNLQLNEKWFFNIGGDLFVDPLSLAGSSYTQLDFDIGLGLKI
jgi:hypothetical protein